MKTQEKMKYRGHDVRDCNCFNGADHAPDCNYILDIDGIDDYLAEVDDSVKCCPDCERPNQFGEVCSSCERDQQELDAEGRL